MVTIGLMRVQEIRYFSIWDIDKNEIFLDCKIYFFSQPKLSTVNQQPYASETSRVFQQPSPSHSTTSLPQEFGHVPVIRKPTNQTVFNTPPPEPAYNQPQSVFTKPPPQTFQHQAPPQFNQAPPPKSGPSFSYSMPNINQPPPSHARLQNPFPQYKFQLFCPQCLIFFGKPWYYHVQNNTAHQCLQNILAFYVQNELRQNCWVKARERTSHRSFIGSYILCKSVTSGNIELCKFRENCSFAHNVIEQRMWKLEQEGKFDIAEFILQNKKQNTSASSSSSTGENFRKIAVQNLLSKHEGYFRFICRDCFFAPRPMISSKGNNNTCTGAARHHWDTSRIIAHVKNTTFTPVDNRKFHHTGAFYLMCNFMHYCRHWLDNK